MSDLQTFYALISPAATTSPTVIVQRITVADPQIWSPQTTGELWPPPGSLIFQLKSFSVQVTGIDLASLIPWPLGPRKRPHS